MFLLVTSFLAGILTVFAPCVLILLPVIVGSSLATDENKKADRIKPYVIVISLGISVLLFTLLLKASTLLIGIDPQVWKTVSGGIVVVLGLSMLFPLAWAKLSAKLGFENSSNTLLAKASEKSGIGGYILTGAALGPVFSACSPVYALILATVLPVNLALGLVYMTLYALGLSLALLAIALAGRKLTKRLNWTAAPNGWFRRTLAIILILVGLAVITGFDKKVQTWILIHSPINSTRLEEKLVPSNGTSGNSNSPGLSTSDQASFNVKPYPAPELVAIQNWINSDPQTIAGLKGKVVLIDFWTYSCINCVRTQPYLNSWYSKYKDQGLVILGIHAPEFGFEKVPENVRKAVVDAKIGYPVGLDNDFATWQAYNNQYWPAKYLIDKDGMVRFTHFGEGKYDETEKAIQTLLGAKGALTSTPDSSSRSSNITPETYLGTARAVGFTGSDKLQNGDHNYTETTQLKTNSWTLGGSWTVTNENITSQQNAKLVYRVHAKDVYLVVASGGSQKLNISIDGKPSTVSSESLTNGVLKLDGARLYHIGHLDGVQDSTVEITMPSGVTLSAFTFGG